MSFVIGLKISEITETKRIDGQQLRYNPITGEPFYKEKHSWVTCFNGREFKNDQYRNDEVERSKLISEICGFYNIDMSEDDIFYINDPHDQTFTGGFIGIHHYQYDLDLKTIQKGFAKMAHIPQTRLHHYED